MEFKNRVSNKMWCLFLILCLSKVAYGELMCYVCEDCAKVTADTPKFECNEEFFNAAGATDSSVQTTTELPETPAIVTEDTSTTGKPSTTSSSITTEESTTTSTTTTTTTTEAKLPETTTDITTETVTETEIETTTEMTNETTTLEDEDTTHETTSTTEAKPPTPPTVGPPMTTTSVPTPPNPSNFQPLDDTEALNNHSLAHGHHVNIDDVENVEVEHATIKTYKPSNEFRVRQMRSVSDVTYHCFKVKATKLNGTKVVNRGCSRVATMESVCGQWEAQHPNQKMNQCFPCSRNMCNGSSALTVSLGALILAVVAVFMHRQ